MYSQNAAKIVRLLTSNDVVLDIGGWARPFNRANYVIDVEPYQTRGYLELPSQGGDVERFTRSTWIQRDLCDKAPFPFANKEVDFVICSHTLEDIRDPLWVCSEMVRIAKRGYIEVPSRVAESCRGIEPGLVGWSHHRWLIEIGENSIEFVMKYHTIHSHWRFSLSPTYLNSLREEQRLQWLFWDESFSHAEKIIHGQGNIDAELEGFVSSVRANPRWRVTVDKQLRNTRTLIAKVARRSARVVGLPAHL